MILNLAKQIDGALIVCNVYSVLSGAVKAESHDLFVLLQSLQQRIANSRPGLQPSPAQVLHNRLIALQQRAQRKRSVDAEQVSTAAS